VILVGVGPSAVEGGCTGEWKEEEAGKSERDGEHGDGEERMWVCDRCPIRTWLILVRSGLSTHVPHLSCGP